LKVFIGSEHYFVKGGIRGLIDISMSATLNAFTQLHPALNLIRLGSAQHIYASRQQFGWDAGSMELVDRA
jgi:hypothetical protein